VLEGGRGVPAPPPPVQKSKGKGGPTAPSLFTKLGDPFLQIGYMKFNMKKTKEMKILKNDEGLKTVTDA